MHPHSTILIPFKSASVSHWVPWPGWSSRPNLIKPWKAKWGWACLVLGGETTENSLRLLFRGMLREGTFFCLMLWKFYGVSWWHFLPTHQSIMPWVCLLSSSAEDTLFIDLLWLFWLRIEGTDGVGPLLLFLAEVGSHALLLLSTFGRASSV